MQTDMAKKMEISNLCIYSLSPSLYIAMGTRLMKGAKREASNGLFRFLIEEEEMDECFE